ncbi:HAAS signaling domain-containing protein [Bacillus sp. FSL K6-3431]|uniref:HAAS signaling domain-containing protein n=1 Tax=Bacillus sp. FSL K6-3431 TaxID=2921500 RepID=UPI0030FA2661
MNKYQFLKILDSSLNKLSAADRLDILQDFEEHFAMGMEEGKSEEEIADSLGSPQHIAKELVASHHLEKVEAIATAGNILRAVWAVIGLGFFNLVIVLAPFLALIAVVIAGWTAAAGFIVSPLLVLISAVIFQGAFEFFDLFASLAFAGLGLFIAIGMFFATRVLTQGFVRYLQFNVKLIKGGLKHD